MAKNFREIYQAEPELSEFRRLRIPDIMTEKVSCWTYADMKHEFQTLMKMFADQGFTDDCILMAYKCVRLSLSSGDRDEIQANSMTENAMALTIYADETLKSGDLNQIYWLKESYSDKISAYRNASTHGLILSTAEQAELDRDIDSVLKRLSTENPQTENRQWNELNFERSSFKFDKDIDEILCVADPPADGDKRLRERLSDRAYAIMTEYERAGKITDIGVLESKCLAPQGLKHTKELREFIELYDGRVFAWQHTDFLSMDEPFSCSNFKGHSISLEVRAPFYVSGDEYFINAFAYHVAGDWGPYIGSNGKIYDSWNNMKLLANSAEEFIEMEAREYFKDRLLLERRRELENKYLIPEIRTASK